MAKFFSTPLNRKGLILASLGSSLLLHCFAIYFIFNHPFTLFSSTQKREPPPLPKESQLLTESLNQTIPNKVLEKKITLPLLIPTKEPCPCNYQIQSQHIKTLQEEIFPEKSNASFPFRLSSSLSPQKQPQYTFPKECLLPSQMPFFKQLPPLQPISKQITSLESLSPLPSKESSISLPFSPDTTIRSTLSLSSMDSQAPTLAAAALEPAPLFTHSSPSPPKDILSFSPSLGVLTAKAQPLSMPANQSAFLDRAFSFQKEIVSPLMLEEKKTIISPFDLKSSALTSANHQNFSMLGLERFAVAVPQKISPEKGTLYSSFEDHFETLPQVAYQMKKKSHLSMPSSKPTLETTLPEIFAFSVKEPTLIIAPPSHSSHFNMLNPKMQLPHIAMQVPLFQSEFHSYLLGDLPDTHVVVKKAPSTSTQSSLKFQPTTQLSLNNKGSLSSFTINENICSSVTPFAISNISFPIILEKKTDLVLAKLHLPSTSSHSDFLEMGSFQITIATALLAQSNAPFSSKKEKISSLTLNQDGVHSISPFAAPEIPLDSLPFAQIPPTDFIKESDFPSHDKWRWKRPMDSQLKELTLNHPQLPALCIVKEKPIISDIPNPKPLHAKRLPFYFTINEEISPLLGMFKMSKGAVTPNMKEPLQSFDVNTAIIDTNRVLAKAQKINITQRRIYSQLSELPDLDELNTISFYDEFMANATLYPSPDKDGYYFSISLKPNSDLYLEPLNQNFVFIIDRARSIKKHRFNMYKKSVHQALNYLKEGDRFNIIIADNKLTKLSEEGLTYSEASIKKAKDFLLEESYFALFAPHDAYDLLHKVCDLIKIDEQPTSIIYISDGSTLKTLNRKRAAIKRLLEQNQNQFTLYTAAASQGNNLTMLDLISVFNKGEFLYSQTNAAFPRKFSILVKQISSLVAKDINVNITPVNAEANLEIYPYSSQMPHLFSARPQMIYGKVNQLTDFDLIIQGKVGDHWVNIKKRIALSEANKGTRKEEKNWAIQKAYSLYESYLADNHSHYLAEAETLLKPYDVKLPIR